MRFVVGRRRRRRWRGAWSTARSSSIPICADWLGAVGEIDSWLGEPERGIEHLAAGHAPQPARSADAFDAGNMACALHFLRADTTRH